MTDEAAARAELVAKRFKEQKPAEGSEAHLRRVIEELRTGQPDYSKMTPKFADVTRQQLSFQTPARDRGIKVSVSRPLVVRGFIVAERG
jgi:uncharacterized protein (DUF3084 family)